MTIAVPLMCAPGSPVSSADGISIYGVVDMALVREAGGQAGALAKVSSSVPMGPRLGFSGSEDLGRRVEALFPLENGFHADTGEF